MDFALDTFFNRDYDITLDAQDLDLGKVFTNDVSDKLAVDAQLNLALKSAIDLDIKNDY